MMLARLFELAYAEMFRLRTHFIPFHLMARQVGQPVFSNNIGLLEVGSRRHLDSHIDITLKSYVNTHVR